jgi:hypothetical protein
LVVRINICVHSACAMSCCAGVDAHIFYHNAFGTSKVAAA